LVGGFAEHDLLLGIEAVLESVEARCGFQAAVPGLGVGAPSGALLAEAVDGFLNWTQEGW
jgi:hypothetical protein